MGVISSIASSIEGIITNENQRSAFFDKFFDRNTIRLAETMINGTSLDEIQWSLSLIMFRSIHQYFRITNFKFSLDRPYWGDGNFFRGSVSNEDRKNLAIYFLREPLGKLQMLNKIRYVIENYPIQKQDEPVCWAYAIATAIYLGQSRIVGRKVTPFYLIKKTILDDLLSFGHRGLDEEEFQTAMRTSFHYYGFHYNKVYLEDLKKIISEGRVCVVDLELTKLQWCNFSYFFINENNKNKAITYNDLNKYLIGYDNITKGGHVLILADIKDDELIFINSWGRNWANNGWFKAKINAFTDITFYDVYFYEEELSENERKLWNQKCQIATERFFKLIDYIDLSIFQKTFYIFIAQNAYSVLKNIAREIDESNRSSFYRKFEEIKNVIRSFSLPKNDNQIISQENFNLISHIGYLPILAALIWTWVDVYNELLEIKNDFWS